MAPTTAEQPRLRTPFEALGGEAGLRRLVDAFYDAMDSDPAAAGLRAMHGRDLAPMRERLSDWLSGWMGGPPVYGARHPGRPCIMSAHGALRIGAAEAEQWMDCMRRALAEADPPADLRRLLETAFGRMCEAMRTA